MQVNKEKGFVHIGTIIVAIIVVAAVAFGGWYVWQNNGDKTDNQSNGSASQEEKTEAERNEEETKQAEADKYLVIKEWGVKMPLSEEIAEAYYEFSSDNLADYVALYDAGFDGLKNTNGVSCGGEHAFLIYSLSRTKPENVDDIEYGFPEYQKFPFSEEYLFGGVGASQAPPYCANLSEDPYSPFREDTNILRIADDKEQAFREAFKKLEAVK